MKFVFLALTISLVVPFASFFTPGALAQTGPQKVESQRSIRDLIGMSPEIKKHVDRAMNMFRAEESCSTKSNRSSSKLCTEVLTFDHALKANAAEQRACQAACVKGASGSTSSQRSKATDLASCVDKSCADECLRNEKLFEFELDRYLKGSLLKKYDMNEFMTEDDFRSREIR